MSRTAKQPDSGREHDTLVPIITDRLSTEDEMVLDGMHSGEKGKLAAVLAVAGLVLAGGFIWMKTVDARAAYLDAAGQTEQLVTKTLGSFGECTAPSAGPVAGDAKALWSDALVRRSALGGRAHAQTLARCVPMLDALESELGTVETPDELEQPLLDTRSAVAELRASFESYRDYVATSGARFDQAEGTKLAAAAVTAWQNVEQHVAELNAAAARHAHQ